MIESYNYYICEKARECVQKGCPHKTKHFSWLFENRNVCIDMPCTRSEYENKHVHCIPIKYI